MREDLIPSMDEFNRMDKAQQITTLCAVHECDEKAKEKHLKAYLENWNPHPPRQFMEWWPHYGVLQTEKATGRGWEDTNPVTAFNCQAVREVYREGKRTGTLFEEPRTQ